MIFLSHEEAVSFPKGDIVLGFCEDAALFQTLPSILQSWIIFLLLQKNKDFQERSTLMLKNWHLVSLRNIIYIISIFQKSVVEEATFWPCSVR